MENLLFLTKISKLEQIELVKQARQGDQTSKDKLVLSCVGMIKQRIIQLANQNTWCYSQLNLIYDDLLNTGILGVLHAFEKFDVSRNTAFSSYAFFWIGAFLKKQFTILRETRYSQSQDTLEETVVDEYNEAMFDKAFSKMLCSQLLSVLENFEREIVVMFFGINCRRYKLKEIASIYKVSFQYVGKIKQRALQKMRNSYKYMLKCA